MTLDDVFTFFVRACHWGIAKLVKAHDFDSCMRGFKSRYPDQLKAAYAVDIVDNEQTRLLHRAVDSWALIFDGKSIFRLENILFHTP